MMKSNSVFLALVVTIGLAGLWYTGNALYLLYGYHKLDARTPAGTIQWSIKEVNDERFLLDANYDFTLEGKSYIGSTLFSNLPYRNKWGAEEAIKDYDQQNWSVWYNKNDPDYSSLQKNYPYKELFYSGVLWALVIYFIWLGYYTSKKHF